MRIEHKYFYQTKLYFQYHNSFIIMAEESYYDKPNKIILPYKLWLKICLKNGEFIQ